MPAMRHFTRIFKNIMGLGAEPKSYIQSMWGTVRRAALQAKLADADAALLGTAIAFIDKIVGVVADLPKPDDDQQELPEQKPEAKAGEQKPPSDPPGTDVTEGNRG